jgi:protocatechuate 3,4-dioxygenase, alpha subunit
MTTESPLVPTPGQTVGPFFGYALPYEGGEYLVPPGHPDAVRLTGLVVDGDGNGIPDALLEIWQPDSAGQIVPTPGSLRRDGWTFTGWGRAATDNKGRYSFTTVRPGPTEPGKLPFFAIVVFARGLTNRLFTRAYLPARAEDLAADLLLGSLSEDRRRTLIAAWNDDELQFDVRLQGRDETVFLSFDRSA